MSEKKVEKLPESEKDFVPPDFSKLLVPGDEIPAELPFGKAQGTGNALGVIYLREKPHPDARFSKDTNLRTALRYLKGQSQKWLAMNPGLRGRSSIDCFRIMELPHNAKAVEDIRRVCKETGQSLAWTFHTCDLVIDGEQPEHIRRWWIVPAPGVEGVWCIFYV